jgi:hypothetical protein
MSAVGLLMKMMSYIGKSVLNSLEEKSKDPLRYQEELLMSVLQDNKDTEYGKKHGFSDIHSIEEYQKQVPLGEYDDFAPYIERMVKGEDNVLVKEHIDHYNKTSGTLGLSKYIPLSEKQTKICGKYFALQSNAAISTQIGYGWNDGMGINLMEGTAVVLESGATYGCASSVSVRKGPLKNFYSRIYTSPIEAKQPEAGVITRYIHARFALCERNATYVVATFSSLIFEFFTYIEHNHEMLVKDIENGTIDNSVDLPEGVRKSLMEKIKPDPKRAAELREAFAEGFSSPWAKRIWKKLQYMYSAGGANFAPYTEKLRKNILGPDVHIFYLGISASEGFFSTVYRMDEVPSLLTPDSCFMEFIEADDENAKCLTMDKLEKGKSYEIVVTNFGGLYRYRMHDVITVTGFHNKTPLVEFQSRAGYAANIRGEKTSESAVRHAVHETERILGLDIFDFSIYPDTDAEPPTYVVYLEITHRPDGITDDRIRDVLEEQLILANRELEYDLGEGYLAPIRLVLLQRETYMLYRDVMIMKGMSASQLKPVNVIRNEFQRKFLTALEETD